MSGVVTNNCVLGSRIWELLIGNVNFYCHIFKIYLCYQIRHLYRFTAGPRERVYFSGSLEEAVLGNGEEAIKLTCPQSGPLGLPANKSL